MKSKDNNSFQEMKKSKFILVRLTWILLGSIFVGVGTIGIFVPGLPTTVFLILAAACYVRSSEKLYNWLIKNKTFGRYIRDYREGNGMPKRAKFIALSMMTIFVCLAILPYSPMAIPNIYVRASVLIVGIIGFYYVGFRIPTQKPD